MLYYYNRSQRDALFLNFIWQRTLHVSDMTRYVNKTFTISAEPFAFSGTFLQFKPLCNIEFYLQNILKFNYNAHVYTLVILTIFKISV